jgi:hypothetical protein
MEASMSDAKMIDATNQAQDSFTHGSFEDKEE